MPVEAETQRILVVDDAAATLEVLQRNLTAEGYRVFTAGSAAEALAFLERTPVELVITDLKMPGQDGLTLVRHVRENFRNTEVMMITGFATVEGAVEAVKTGAEEYLAKPFTDEELSSAVRRTLDKRRLHGAYRAATSSPARMPYGLMGDSEAMRSVHRAIAKAAATSATVLISGESGTGKELVARAIHYSGARGSAPFVAVNCGAIPEGLLESELFGHIKGAFSGATDSRAGFFQTADGGTIFLDEIAETSSSMQVKLLRVLQDKEICMVGATRTRRVDVRIVAATNRDPFNLMEKGILREDLFYRLNVIAISVPPLRDRGDDVLLLVHHFGARFAAEFGRPAPEFSDNALRALADYHWPGNVRELENVIQRLVVMNEGSAVEVVDLPSLMRFSASRDSGPQRTLAEVEAQYIRTVVESVGGNRSQAARILGIDRKTLRTKLKFRPRGTR